MAKSALIKSSIVKKYWMALTGLFLCLFLVGHLLGNLQLFASGYEGALQFNKYAYFMTTNPAVKILSYVTYISIIFHAVDGIFLTIQNRKARPIQYAMSKPQKNSGFASRNMAVLGTLVLIFISTHMMNFWAKMKFGSEMPLFVKEIAQPGSPMKQYQLIATPDSPQPSTQVNGPIFNNAMLQKQATPGSPSKVVIEGTKIFNITKTKVKENGKEVEKEDKTLLFEGYKDLHKLTVAFFKSNKTLFGIVPKEGLAFTIFYVLSMLALAFHLWHGFQSAFQSLGVRGSFTPAIQLFGKAFAIVVPLLFASLPIYIRFFLK